MQWGTVDAEIRVPGGEIPELQKCSPFEAMSRSECSHACFSHCYELCSCPTLYFPSPFTFIPTPHPPSPPPLQFFPHVHGVKFTAIHNQPGSKMCQTVYCNSKLNMHLRFHKFSPQLRPRSAHCLGVHALRCQRCDTSVIACRWNVTI